MEAAAIQTLRKALGLSQVELSQIVDVHYVTVSRWEVGHATPSAWHTSVLLAFERGLERAPAVCAQVRLVLAGSGAISALYLLLRAAFEDGLPELGLESLERTMK